MFLSESRRGDAGTKIVVDRPGAPRLVEAGVDGDVRGEDNASDQAPAWIHYNSEGSSGLR